MQAAGRLEGCHQDLELSGRKLRSLGALYLQQSVCLLPDREPVRRQVQRLLASIRADGGAARSLTVTVEDQAQYAGLVAEFNAERDAEYAEVVERAPQLLAELEKETARRPGPPDRTPPRPGRYGHYR